MNLLISSDFTLYKWFSHTYIFYSYRIIGAFRFLKFSMVFVTLSDILWCNINKMFPFVKKAPILQEVTKYKPNLHTPLHTTKKRLKIMIKRFFYVRGDARIWRNRRPSIEKIIIIHSEFEWGLTKSQIRIEVLIKNVFPSPTFLQRELLASETSIFFTDPSICYPSGRFGKISREPCLTISLSREL